MRYLLIISVFFICTLLSGDLMGQSKENKQLPSSRDPGFHYHPGKKKKQGFFKRLFSRDQSTKEYFDQTLENYEKRKKEVAKEKAKMAKEMEKPQYSDPTYFGHKKKPKKRPPGKRKFCEECGIRH